MEKDHDTQAPFTAAEEITSLSLTPPSETGDAAGEHGEDAVAEAAARAVPEPEPDHIVLLCGGGHMAQEVARQALHAGFAVDVIDTREDYASEERFPQARRVVLCTDYAVLDEEYTLDNRHYVVILTHSYETDLEVLLHSLHSPARYIGVAGSERKKENIFAELRERGIPDAELACVRCPIGFAIGAESTEEMGIAIAAELIAARAGCLTRPRRPRRAVRSGQPAPSTPENHTSGKGPSPQRGDERASGRGTPADRGGQSVPSHDKNQPGRREQPADPAHAARPAQPAPPVRPAR